MLRDKMKDENIMTRLNELIAAHLHEGQKQEFYTQQMKVTATQLERCVSINYGLSLRRYLIEKRNAAAYRLLLESDLQIKEIAFAVGFASGSAFCSTFKALKGIGPDAYRKARGIDIKQLQTSALMVKLDGLMDSNMASLRTATQYANLLNVCTKTLDNCVRFVHGIGLGKYLQQRRTAEALRLLKETDLRVKEISKRIGFKQPSTLCKTFKASGSATPKQYRATYKSKISYV